MKNMNWYVLNYDFNKKQVVDFNIFNNWRFAEAVEEAVDIYYKQNLTIEDLIEKIDSVAKWQFWSRREYEISVGDLFEQDLDKYEKIDVYRQIAKNIENLTIYVLNKYNTQSE